MEFGRSQEDHALRFSVDATVAVKVGQAESSKRCRHLFANIFQDPVFLCGGLGCHTVTKTEERKEK